MQKIPGVRAQREGARRAIYALEKNTDRLGTILRYGTNGVFRDPELARIIKTSRRLERVGKRAENLAVQNARS